MIHEDIVKLRSRSGPGQVQFPGQVQGLRTKDLDLGYTLNLVCHPPTHHHPVNFSCRLQDVFSHK